MWNDKLGRFIDSRFFLITCKMVYPGGRVKFLCSKLLALLLVIIFTSLSLPPSNI